MTPINNPKIVVLDFETYYDRDYSLIKNDHPRIYPVASV